MSRSKKDILDTEAMLQRLTELLAKHHSWAGNNGVTKTARHDAESLRRISITLRFWFEQECNGDIQRDEVSQKPHYYWHNNSGPARRSPAPIPDREAGARKRLAQILKRYPSLTAYVQTDPRGCALYLLQKSDIPPGADVASCYNRGLAVHQ